MPPFDNSSNDPSEQFLELLALHEAQLLGFLYALVHNQADAEDLFQQTVLTMWQKFDEFESGSNFIGWGCSIARNKAMNLFKSKRPGQIDQQVLDLLVAAQEREEPTDRHARRRALAECLKKLSLKDSQLVQAAYAEGQSIKLVAEQLNRSASGVYNSLARIRAALYRCIEMSQAQEGHA